jgi:hypothetical protein
MKKFFAKFFPRYNTRSALYWTAEDWADYLRDRYRNLLSKGPDDEVTADDLYWAKEALDEYEGLKPEAKALLPGMKAALEGLLCRKR